MRAWIVDNLATLWFITEGSLWHISKPMHITFELNITELFILLAKVLVLYDSRGYCVLSVVYYLNCCNS